MEEDILEKNEMPPTILPALVSFSTNRLFKYRSSSIKSDTTNGDKRQTNSESTLLHNKNNAMEWEEEKNEENNQKEITAHKNKRVVNIQSNVLYTPSDFTNGVKI